MSAVPASGQAGPGGRAEHEALREDARRGVVYDGLRPAGAGDPCRGNFRLESSFGGPPECTHGPDPAPEGIDVRSDRPDLQPAPASALATEVPCAGNGSDGFRVQLVYARALDRPDGYSTWLASMRQWAARVNDVFDASAAQTGGSRQVRFVHDANCVPLVDNLILSSRGDDTFDLMLREMRLRGYNRTDRKYLVWVDANVYCGIGQIYIDDSPGQGNASNGHPGVPGAVARVDKGCWGLNEMVEAHELVHTLGGVQPTAPNATPGFHCTDNYDRLCYSDGTGVATVVCSNFALENRLDCNNDDYYSTNPPPGSYLANHWNVANSRFLIGGGSSPTTSTTTSSSTSTTSTTTTSTTTTTTPTSTTSTTTPPPTTSTTSTTTSTTAPPGTGVPSAPRSAYATQPPAAAAGLSVFWSPPLSSGTSPLTAYRVYRGTSPSALSLLAEVGPGTTTYLDSTAPSRVIVWYHVTAVNASGESPPSNLARMIAR